MSVERHYARGGILRAIHDALAELGKDPSNLSPADLAPVDEFHIRGREATIELARLADLAPGTRVLDVGCGLGGSSRYLAAEHGCRVTGVDLTEEYVAVAAALSAEVGLAESTEFRQCSALALPFEDGTFDVAWTEHAQMNIEDKRGFYGEIARVLRPGGRFVFHDIFCGDGGDLVCPVPWAEDPSISFLISSGELRAVLGEAGLVVREWADRTAESLAWYERILERVAATGPSPLGLHLLMGATSKQKFQNGILNLQEKRIVVLQAACDRR